MLDHVMLTSRLAHTTFFVAILLIGVVLFFFSDNKAIYQENGLLENLQAGFLLACTTLFFWAAVHLQYRQRYAVFFFSWLAFAFFLREVDVEKFDLPQIVILFGSGNGRAVFLLPLAVVLFYIGKNARHYLGNLRAYVGSGMTFYLVMAAIFLIAGWPLDRQYINPPHRVFFEEMFELAGYYFFFISGLVSISSMKRLILKEV